VSSAQALHLASQLQIAAYLDVIQDAEAVDHRDRLSRSLYDHVRVKIEVLSVPHSKDKRIDATQRLLQIFLHPQVFQLRLVSKEDAPVVIRIIILIFKFPPVVDIGVVNLISAPISASLRMRISDPL